MKTVEEQILEHIKPLVGLQLSFARRAADMRNFGFGKIRAVKNGTVADYALHIQCPWRIESTEGIVTGRLDLWERPNWTRKRKTMISNRGITRREIYKIYSLVNFWEVMIQKLELISIIHLCFLLSRYRQTALEDLASVYQGGIV